MTLFILFRKEKEIGLYYLAIFVFLLIQSLCLRFAAAKAESERGEAMAKALREPLLATTIPSKQQ